MKIFSELIIDSCYSCFKNSEYCTCSSFRMISASSIFAIVILHHFACKNLIGLGAPNLLCSLPVEELKPCQAFLIKMFEAPMISKSIVYARKVWKVKERTTLISSVFLHLDRPFNNRPSSPFRHLRHSSASVPVREVEPNSHHSSGFSPMFWGCGKWRLKASTSNHPNCETRNLSLKRIICPWKDINSFFPGT